MLDIHDPRSLEKYSAAVSLSDMELFIYPDLMYALVLANIMSPRLWEWKKDPWFAKMPELSPYRRALRIKQYIMDQYDFNLDLDTWGLTTKAVEKERFADFVDPETLAQSNALFGYEGDRYYFDIDIRKHFGLEQYTDETIPYWKTETVEAMDSFHRREGYDRGAGECVSLSALYYAALFVLGEIPTEDIVMIATPLHSQNFVLVNEGFLTNNRRLVTKNMWFNGTALSAKAKRALRNERVTALISSSGYVHRLYREATMPENEYRRMLEPLTAFLLTDVTYEILANFLREYQNRQICFQFEHDLFDQRKYIPAEVVYRYEHSSPYMIGTGTEKKLLDTIEADEFYPHPLEGRISLRAMEEFFGNNRLSVRSIREEPGRIAEMLASVCSRAQTILPDLLAFCETIPRVPDYREKTWVPGEDDFRLTGLSRREEVLEHIGHRQDTETGSLALMAYRQIEGDRWVPFLKAALERNPVSLAHLAGRSARDAYGVLLSWDDESIYGENRLAQPDEVANFRTGDGLEKAVLLWNHLKNQLRVRDATLTVRNRQAVLTAGGDTFAFATDKEVRLPEELPTVLARLGIA